VKNLRIIKIFSRAGIFTLSIILVASVVFIFNKNSYASPSSSSLVIETDMRLSGVSYSNLDYDNKTSTDAVSFYYQRLRLGVGGKFSDGVEIMARIQSIGVVGSSATTLLLPQALNWSHNTYSSDIYPDITGRPFIENLYFRLKKFLGYSPNVEVIIGRQPFDIGEGLMSDNTAGINALRLKVNYPQDRLITDIFTAKISEGFYPDKDFDVHGVDLSYNLRADTFTFVYLTEQDCSGTLYRQGAASVATSKIARNFYKGILRHYDEFGEYGAHYGYSNGEIVKADGSGVIPVEGYSWGLEGMLKARDTKIGDVKAGLIWSMFSGDDDATSVNDKDESFSPTLAPRRDGLDSGGGYGRLFGASGNTTAIKLPDGYSGINTIGLNFSCQPFYGWEFGVDYFLFSATEHVLKPQKEASGFERLLGAKYSLGAEMDLNVKYRYSRYIDIAFGYFRYTPPLNEIFWEKYEALSKYVLEFNAKF